MTISCFRNKIYNICYFINSLNLTCFWKSRILFLHKWIRIFYIFENHEYFLFPQTRIFHIFGNHGMDTNISHFRVLTNIFCFRNILVRLFHFSDNDFGKMDISEKDIGKIKYPNIQKDYIFVHQENGKNHISCSE